MNVYDFQGKKYFCLLNIILFIISLKMTGLSDPVNKQWIKGFFNSKLGVVCKPIAKPLVSKFILLSHFFNINFGLIGNKI